MKRKNVSQPYEYPDWVQNIISPRFVNRKIYEYDLQSFEDDICQEFVIRLLSAKKQKKSINFHFGARVLSNVLNDFYHRVKKDVKKDHDLDSLKTKEHDGPGPVALAIHKELLQLVPSLIHRLSQKDQLVLTLRFNNDYTFKQIAEAMGYKNEGGARMPYGKIMRKLKMMADKKNKQE